MDKKRTPIAELPYSAGLMSQSCWFVEFKKIVQLIAAGKSEEAFAGCTNLIDLIIPWTVVMVDDDAFAGMNSGFCLICTQHSAAEQYARKHNVPFQIVL